MSKVQLAPAKASKPAAAPQPPLFSRSTPRARKPPRERAPKLAEVVSDALEREIVQLGWPVGKLLGTEASLAARFGVHRATIREALRQLEASHITTMRRGAGGGAIVAEPAGAATAHALESYMEFADVSVTELFETRLLLELQAARLAAERIDEPGIEKLRMLSRQLGYPVGSINLDAVPHMAIRGAIAGLTGNPALVLFMEALNRSTTELLSLLADPSEVATYASTIDRTQEAKRKLIGAVIAGDAAAAQMHVREDVAVQMDAIRGLLQRRAANASVPTRAKQGTVARWTKPTGDRVQMSLSHSVALAISRDAAQLGWPVGERLGSEPEMIERYKVSRSVFREAVRMLEPHGIVRMRKGNNGGLIAGAPDPTHTIASAVNYLRFMKLNPLQLLEVREGLELRSVQIAAARISDADIAKLRNMLHAEVVAAEKNVLATAVEVQQLVVDLSGNRALSLLISVLIRLNMWDTTLSPDMHEKIAQLRRSHNNLGQALILRDEDLSRRRMLEHLQLVRSWLIEPAARAVAPGRARR